MMKEPTPIGHADLTHAVLMSARQPGIAGGPRLSLWVNAETATALTHGAVSRFVLLEVEPTEALVSVINENCIYDVTPQSAAAEYMLVFTPFQLVLKYQTICGGRTLVPPSEATRLAFAVRLCEICGVAMPEVAAPVTAISDEPEPVLKRELRMLRAEGNTIFLPQEQLTEYKKIKQLLETAGAKYKRLTFVFSGDRLAQDVLDALIGGDRLNPQKDWQFFQSPESVADDVVAAVGPLAGKRVLEPSAGEGAIAKKALAQGAAEVVTVEAWDAKAKILRRTAGFTVLERDFLTVTPQEIGLFDAVVANPPFTGNQDVEHVMHMLKFLKPGGTLSSVMSVSWQHGSQRKQVEFRQFLADVGAEIVQIPAGAFKSSGTSVATVRVVIEADRVAALTGLRAAA